MAANLPQPIYFQQPQQRGLGEALLLSLAGAAPDFLQGWLQQRQQNQVLERQGQADLAALQAMTSQNQSPEATALLQQLGAQVINDPAIGAPAGFSQGVPGAQTISTASIDPKMASGALDRFRQLQSDAQSRKVAEAQIGQIQAATDATRSAEARAVKREPLEQRKLQAETSRIEADALLSQKQLANADEMLRLDRMQIESAINRNREDIAASREQRAQAQVAFVQGGVDRWEAAITDYANALPGNLSPTERKNLAASALGYPLNPNERRAYWEQQAASPDPRRAVEGIENRFSRLPEAARAAVQSALEQGIPPQQVLDTYVDSQTGLDSLQTVSVAALINYLRPGSNVKISPKNKGFIQRLREAIQGNENIQGQRSGRIVR